MLCGCMTLCEMRRSRSSQNGPPVRLGRRPSGMARQALLTPRPREKSTVVCWTRSDTTPLVSPSGTWLGESSTALIISIPIDRSMRRLGPIWLSDCRRTRAVFSAKSPVPVSSTSSRPDGRFSIPQSDSGTAWSPQALAHADRGDHPPGGRKWIPAPRRWPAG